MDTNWLIPTDHGDGIIELGLNRAPVNALSAPCLMGFADVLADMAGDNAVRAIVLSSRFKVFSAGLDLKEALEFSREDENAIVQGLNVGFTALFAFPKPVVVAIKGAAIAGGLFYVLASDFRVAGPRAKFGLAEVRVGADFPIGPLEIARATLDPNSLRRLMLTGQPMTAPEAQHAGIIDVIEPDEAVVLDRALRAARELASSPATTYASVKRQIRQGALDRIKAGINAGANTPAGGWFSAETKAAMQRMLG